MNKEHIVVVGQTEQMGAGRVARVRRPNRGEMLDDRTQVEELLFAESDDRGARTGGSVRLRCWLRLQRLLTLRMLARHCDSVVFSCLRVEF